MAIDGIGKPRGPASPFGPPPNRGDTGAASTVDAYRPFGERVPPPAGTAATTAAASPLERFRAGEIDFDGYLQLQVEHATAHLHGLPAEQLDFLRATLRARMATDPDLTELVRAATGRAAAAPDD